MGIGPLQGRFQIIARLASGKARGDGHRTKGLTGPVVIDRPAGNIRPDGFQKRQALGRLRVVKQDAEFLAAISGDEAMFDGTRERLDLLASIAAEYQKRYPEIAAAITEVTRNAVR